MASRSSHGAEVKVAGGETVDMTSRECCEPHIVHVMDFIPHTTMLCVR